MNSQHQQHIDTLQNRFGLRVAAHLSAGTHALPHDVTERLRIAREQALAKRKQPARAWWARLLPASRTHSVLDDGPGPWSRLASAALGLVMVVGLVTIHVMQSDSAPTEVADLDAALLTDELPLEAYADPGFLQYLKTSAAAR